jgi:hypothetical protein
MEIRIGSTFDAKGFKQASKATTSLEKGVKKLSGVLSATFGATQLLKFGKDAVKAFVEDEKAANRLAQSVKNLGLAFETPRIEEFISQLSRASGVTDDQLRPSMQKLLQTTGSVTKSTDLLKQALDISAGSGVDFETVVQDLSAAYVGQTRGLRKYSLGLSQAELKTMSFEQVQEKLSKQFSGANAAYLETYAGKMSILSVAAGEAKETIGKGLVDALSILAGDGNTIQPLADSMADFSKYIADATVGIAQMIAGLKKIPGIGGLGGLGKDNKAVSGFKRIVLDTLNPLNPLKQFLDYAANEGKTATPGMGGYPSSALGGVFIDPNEAARKKAEADAAKRAKELAALQKKALDTQKKANALTKAAKTIDLERIGMTAALRGKISETDRLSLNLQLALLDKNDAAATKLSTELTEAVKRQNALNAALLNTPEAPNPYRNWKAPNLDFGGNLLGSLVPNYTPPAWATSEFFAGGNSGMGPKAPAAANVNVIVQVGDEEVAAKVSQIQTNDSLSGSFNQVNRRGRFAENAIL